MTNNQHKRQKQREYNRNWRFEHPEQRKKQKERYYMRYNNLYNHKSRQKWTPEEINILIKRTDLTDRELSKLLERSLKSIATKRSRLRQKGLL